MASSDHLLRSAYIQQETRSAVFAAHAYCFHLLNCCSDNWKSGKRIWLTVNVYGVFQFFFFFSTQNQVPQTIIGTGRVIYHINTRSVVIEKTKKNQKIAPVSRKTG